MKKHFFFICALVLLNGFLSAQTWTQIGIDIDGEQEGDRFGWSIDLSADGTRLVVGATLSGFENNYAGQVRVYDQINGQWTPVGNPINGTQSLMEFGYDVAISDNGNRIAVGAPKADPSGIDKGSVRIFEWMGGEWLQLGESIDGSFVFDQAGQSIALSSDGNRIAVGAHLNDGSGPNRGHVRVFDFVENQWVQIGNSVNGENTSGQSGWSVTLSANGSIMAVGAISNNENGLLSGQVRTYQFNGLGWAQLGSDINGVTAGDRLGWSIDLSNDGSKMAIGAPQNIESSDAPGYVKIYEFTAENWSQIGETILGEGGNDEFGAAVAFNADGSHIAIGAPSHSLVGNKRGVVRIFELTNGNWSSIASPILGESEGDLFGHAVAFNANGNTLAIGAILNSSESNNAGHVRVFEPGILSSNDQNSLSEIQIYPNPSETHFKINGLSSSTFLTIVDLSGRTVLTTTVENSESVDVRQLSAGTYFVQLSTLDAPAPYSSEKIIIR